MAQCSLPCKTTHYDDSFGFSFLNFCELSISSNQIMESALPLHKRNMVSFVFYLPFSPLSNLLSYENFTWKSQLCRGSLLNYSSLFFPLSVYKRGRGGGGWWSLTHIRNTEELKYFFMPIKIWRNSKFSKATISHKTCVLNDAFSRA